MTVPRYHAILPAIILCLMAWASPAASGAVPSAAPKDLPIESSKTVDTGSFNDQIAAAVEAGEDWPKNPLLVTLRFLENCATARYLNIEMTSEGGEGVKLATFTVIEDGFRDDSVRGEWNTVRLRRQSDRTYRIEDVRRAWRCWRGDHQLASFGKEKCP